MSAKDTMRRNKTAIVRILGGDLTLILSKVHENNLITDREYNNLKHINRANTEDHVIQLVDKIMNKGEDTCQTFLNLLQTDEDIQSTFPELKNLQLNYNRLLPTPLQADTGEHKAVELVARLNNRGYINWLKAGRCLLMLKEGLHPFIDQCIRDFHRDLLNQKPQLRNPCQASCKPKGKNVSSLCKDCKEWTTAILEHHKLSEGNTKHVNLNWDNCFPPSWRTDHWELAKAYMPRGQVSVKGAAQCDASALLYLIINCDHFPNVDEKAVKEVIQFRNELMHSSELNVTDEWMRRYQNSLKKLLQQFNNVPEIETVKQQIDEMFTVDLKILVSDVEFRGLESDSDASQSHQSFFQWEAELLQQRLRELRHGAAADSKTQDTELLKSFVRFLQASEDLHKRFSADLQAIGSLYRGE